MLENFLQHEYAWVGQVFLIVFMSLLANFFASRMLRKLTGKLKATKTVWDDALVDAAARPLAWLIWVIGFAWAVEVVRMQAPDNAMFAAIGPVRDVLVIGLLVWFVVRFIHNAEQGLIAQNHARTLAGDSDEPGLDATTIIAIGKLMRTAVIITGSLVVLQSLGYSISGVLAFGGIGGIAVGFAAKDLLANFFGGLMIFLDRPFSIGDWVRSPDREIEGTVEYIGWRLTRIRTFDKRPLYVPNSLFTGMTVENPSRMENRRIYETIGVRYADAAAMAAIVADVKAMLQGHDEIDTGQTLIVNFNSFAPSSLDFFVYTFTKTTDWVRFHDIKQDVLLKILAVIEKHGAQTAFPTMTLKVDGPGAQSAVPGAALTTTTSVSQDA